MPGFIGSSVTFAMALIEPLSAQGQPARRPPTVDVIFWLGLLVIACVVGYVIVAAARKRIEADDAPTGNVMEAFGLSDLKRMRREGQLSDDEYERARRQVLIAAGAIDPDAEPESPDSELIESQMPASAPENSDDTPDDALGPELLPDTEAGEVEENDPRKRDLDAESEDESNRGFD